MNVRFSWVFVIAACSNSVPASSMFDASLPPPPHVTPPVVACALPDAGCDDAQCDAAGLAAYNTCTLPPSVCADGHWAAYFDNGVCVQGTCELVTKYHYCDQGCANGACISNHSTAPTRGF